MTDATTTTTTADTTTTTTADTTTAAAFDWNAHIADEPMRGYVQNKGFKTPVDVLNSYQNLEKLHGVPAERILKLPGDDKPESWAPIYDKLGRPKEAKEYSIKVPDGADPAFSEAAKGWFHEAGLSNRQAAALAEKWNAHAGGVTKAQTDAIAARDAEQATALRTAWGAEYETRVKLVDEGVPKIGMTADQLKALRDAMGPHKAMEFAYGLVSRLGSEGSFVTGDVKAGGTGGLTPAAARAQIETNKADVGWSKRYLDGGREERAEMERLHKYAYG